MALHANDAQTQIHTKCPYTLWGKKIKQKYKVGGSSRITSEVDCWPPHAHKYSQKKRRRKEEVTTKSLNRGQLNSIINNYKIIRFLLIHELVSSQMNPKNIAYFVFVLRQGFTVSS